MTSSTVVLSQPPGILVERQRISSIDLVRGVVMVIMALDHVRDFYHFGAFSYNPTDMTTTTPALFFTRWVTHFCAPTFVFLAGTSIFLGTRRKSKKELSRFLLSRGLWLIFIEVVVVRFAFFFNFYYDLTILQVIWAIGVSMICMAGLIHFSPKIVLAIGLIIVFGHNITDAWQLQPTDSGYVIWALLRQTGFIQVSQHVAVLAFYPILPWLGIMILGFCMGQLYARGFDPVRRRKLLFQLGGVATALFIILRLINVYGDPAPWIDQKNALYTFMSFLNTTKYPVSLQYALMTLGPVLMLLSWLEKKEAPRLKPLIVFGRVPLFYFVIHFFLIHFTALLFFMNKTGTSFNGLDFHISKGFGGLTGENGYSLFWVYVAWVAIVVALYPLCRWYDKYKSTHANWWLSYL